MGHATIPPATEDEFRVAFTGLRLQAEVHGLDVNDPKVAAFVQHQAEVKAQMMAESRWLNNIIHRMGEK